MSSSSTSCKDPLPEFTAEQIQERNVASEVDSTPVMLVMKGTGEAPVCKFSKEMVYRLDDLGVMYETFDILSGT